MHGTTVGTVDQTHSITEGVIEVLIAPYVILLFVSGSLYVV